MAREPLPPLMLRAWTCRHASVQRLLIEASRDTCTYRGLCGLACLHAVAGTRSEAFHHIMGSPDPTPSAFPTHTKVVQAYLRDARGSACGRCVHALSHMAHSVSDRRCEIAAPVIAHTIRMGSGRACHVGPECVLNIVNSE